MAKLFYRKPGGTPLAVPMGLGYPSEGKVWLGVEICCPAWPIGAYCQHCPPVCDEPGSVYTPRYYDVTVDSATFVGVTVTGDGNHSTYGSPNHRYLRLGGAGSDYVWPPNPMLNDGLRIAYDGYAGKWAIGYMSGGSFSPWWEKLGAAPPEGDYAPVAGAPVTGNPHVSADETYDWPFVGTTFHCERSGESGNFPAGTCEWYSGPVWFDDGAFVAYVAFEATQITVLIADAAILVSDTTAKVCRSGFTTTHFTVEIGQGP